jgi:hypothetical protein
VHSSKDITTSTAKNNREEWWWQKIKRKSESATKNRSTKAMLQAMID